MNLDSYLSRSLKTRVTLFALAIFIVSIWLLAIYASLMLRADTQRLLGKQQLSTATFVAANVNNGLDDRLRSLERVAASVSTTIMGDRAALQTFLQQRMNLQSLFNGGIIALDLDGSVIADAPLSTGRFGVNLMDRDHIYGALKAGKATIGRPFMGGTLHAPIVAMAVPIQDTQGKIIGALAGVTDLGKPSFLDSLVNGHYGNTGGYLLAAPQYRMIITASDKRRVMEAFPAPGVDLLIDRRAQGLEGTEVFVNPRGVEVLSSAKSVPVAGWLVIVSLPTEEAFAPIRDMQLRLLLAALFLTILAGGLIWWMLKRQLAPMLATARALATLSESTGDPQTLPIFRHDEIGDLIGGFNRLLAELGQRKALLRQIFDTSSVAIFLVDMQGRITQANRRMAEMFGCTLDTLVGSEYVSLVHPAQREEGRQKMLDLLGSAIPSVDLDRLYWRANHTEFWGHLAGRRFFNTSGEACGLVGVIADITERKQTEKALRNSEHGYRTMFDSAPEGVWMLGPDRRTTEVNQRMCDLLGYAREDMLGQNPVEFADEENGRVFQERARIVPNRKTRTYEVALRHRDGHNIPTEFSATNLFNEDGSAMGVLAFVVDLTERKQMQEQVRQMAFHDALTNLPNRRLLNDRLGQAMAASKRSGCYGAIMFLDLDNFKSLNDAHGHAVGDLLLIEAAVRLKSCVREVDTVARFGGDEFVVMTSELNADESESATQAGIIAEKIRAALHDPYVLKIRHDGQADTTIEHRCTASIGVALFGEHVASQEDILRRADTVMYQAKAAGRNSVQFYNSNA